jgi:hypothetical protein
MSLRYIVIVLISETKGYVQKHSGLNLYDSERYVRDLIESGRMKEDDAQAVDIPHFHLESILDATNNFASANKLGQGGFGPVYKVINNFCRLIIFIFNYIVIGK